MGSLRKPSVILRIFCSCDPSVTGLSSLARKGIRDLHVTQYKAYAISTQYYKWKHSGAERARQPISSLISRRNHYNATEISSKEVAKLASTSWQPERSSDSTGVVEGQCPVYMLHGLLGFKEEFEQHGQVIADGTGHVVTAFDARNHGSSSHTQRISYPLMAHDLANHMEKHNVKEAILVAHSMGAGSAMCLALQQPERVKALFLIDSVIADVPRRAQLKGFMRFLAALPLPEEPVLDEVYRKLTEDLLQKEVDQFIIRQSVVPNIVMEDGRAKWRVSIDVLARDIENLTNIAAMSDFAGLTFDKPTYVLVGESSDYVSREKERLIYQNFPRAQVQRVGNAGHWVHLCQPEIFLRAVTQFIKNLK